MAMSPRSSPSVRRQPSWRQSISFRCLALVALVYSSCRISQLPLIVEARMPSASAASLTRPNSNDGSSEDGIIIDATSSSSARLDRWGCKRSGLVNSIPSFIKRRVSAASTSSLPGPTPQYLKKDVDFDWSMSTGVVLTNIRGGATSDDESEEYDDEDSTDDEYDSEEEEEVEEYDTESEDEDEYDSEEEEEEDALTASITQTSLKSSVLSKSAQDSSSEIEYDDLLTPPAMQQFGVSIGVMLLSNRIDILDAKAVRIARFAFVAYILSVQVFLLYARLRAKSMDDRTPITISNPLAGLVQNNALGAAMGGGGGNFMVKALADQVLSSQTTILEYDLKQIKKMNSGLLFPMVFLYFLHFRMKQVQPLIMQTATGFLNLVYSPLFQVYVMGRHLERPFKPPVNPMMEAMQQQQEGQASEEEGEEVATSEEEVQEEEDSADEEDEEDSEEEEVSDDEEEESEDEYDSDEE